MAACLAAFSTTCARSSGRGQAQQLLAAPAAAPSPVTGWTPVKPNIVYILCDDLGYGDVHSFNPQRGRISTPQIDNLAAHGMSFTDAHASSSVCTPSRYSILTGRYNWRTRLQAGVLDGDSPPLIEAGRMTVADFLRRQGYATGCIGKWHLGMLFGRHRFQDRIKDGPLEHGFEHYFGLVASLDQPPFVFVHDDQFTEVPTTTKTFVRSGPAAADFNAIDVMPTLVARADEFIRTHAADAKGGKPFFLYLAFTAPHAPILPSAEFQGQSNLSPYGDFVMQVDSSLGQILHSLDDAGLSDNTMVVFTSDNGCSPAANIHALESKGHYPSAQFRGYKSDIWEGGHRVPFVVRWPGVVPANSHYDQTVGLVDLLATCAQITGNNLPGNAGEDSVGLLPALRGTTTAPLREAEVFHSNDGMFAIRVGNWKLELCPGSGGWSQPTDLQAAEERLPRVQLYDLSTDEAERHNLESQRPDIVNQLETLLEEYVNAGRSTPGPAQSNDVPIKLWKQPAKGHRSAPVTTEPVSEP